MQCLTNAEIDALLARLDVVTADDLETEFLEFKPWLPNVKENMTVALEYAVCFANHPDGGVIVFGVKDRARGRHVAITGCSGYDLQTWRTSLYDNIRPRLDGISVEELRVPEGVLLIVRVPKGPEALYGTVGGMFKRRIGKSCMPVDPLEFQKSRVAQGVLDWTAEPAEGITPADLDPVEIARAKNVARVFNPKSGLAELSNREFLQAIKAVDRGAVTRAGLLMLGRADQLESLVSQHLVQYTHEISDTKLARNDFFRSGLLHIIERITEILTGPVNPEREVTVGLFILRIPAFPVDVVRVALHLYDGTFDERMAVLVAKWQKEGRDIGLDGLLLLSYLREHPFLDSKTGAVLLQVDASDARDILGRYCMPPHSLLERRGRKMATYHLVRGIATDLLDKTTYTRLRGVDPVRYREMVKQFVEDHGSITNKEFRELFQLGDSDSAVVRSSQFLKAFCGADGFLRKEGRSSATRYVPKNSESS